MNITPNKEAELLLSSNGYFRSPNYATIYENGERIEVPYPYGAKLRKCKIEGIGCMFIDVILCHDKGYTLIIQHGGIISDSDTFIQFPKYATEDNFNGAFERMEAYIKHNYVYMAGLPAFIYGD